MESIAAILLAAGRSRRMGAFKPLLAFGDKTVIETCIENLRAAGIEEITAVVGHRADEIRARLAHVNVRFAVNCDAESEMGASIACGVDHTSQKAGAVLIALADQPAIPPEIIRRLISERERTGASLVLPQWQGRGGHPVLIDLCYRDELLNLDAQKGLRALLDDHPAHVLRVSVDSPYVARDIDLWEDYRALHEEVFGFSPPLLLPPPPIEQR